MTTPKASGLLKWRGRSPVERAAATLLRYVLSAIVESPTGQYQNDEQAK